MYGYERGTSKPSANAATASGYIGLMYPSDYGYSVLASDGSTSCSRTEVNLSTYNTAVCAGKAWMNSGFKEYTISASETSTYSVGAYHGNGQFGTNNSSNSASVRPVLYLTNKTYVISGSGAKTNPFIIGFDAN